MIKIEHNVPIPHYPGETEITLKKMSIGDSVVVPYNSRCYWRVIAKRLGEDIVMRRLRDNNGNFTKEIRIWKVRKL